MSLSIHLVVLAAEVCQIKVVKTAGMPQFVGNGFYGFSAVFKIVYKLARFFIRMDYQNSRQAFDITATATSAYLILLKHKIVTYYYLIFIIVQAIRIFF